MVEKEGETDKVKKSKSISFSIAMILTCVTAALVISVFIFLPWVTKAYIDYTGRCSEHYGKILVVLYAAVTVALVAVCFILRLLSLVSKDEIFTLSAVRAVRTLALCCFGESVLFGLLALFYAISLLLAFAAAFLGTLMLVQESVFRSAAELKKENDFTI